MHWMSDTSAGDWLRERLDEPWNATMHAVVPHGFPAYARILHPGIVRSLPDRPVPTYDEYDAMPEAERQALFDRFIDEPATWAETASAFGTTLHPLAQWQRIVRTPMDGDWRTRISPDGREFSAPTEGELAPEMLTSIASHLIAHTTTPDAGFAALWEGRGGLVGHMGHGPSRAFYTFSDDPNHQAMLDRSVKNPFNNAFRKRTWQEGILSREISEGPRFRLPDRDHVLFRGAIGAFANQDWVLDVPWRDRPGEEHGFAPSAQTPSILWPDDHAWVMVSEIDHDSTIVAGSTELVAAICADERLEAFLIPENADLTWDADEVNR
ncbi:hypothetical protein FIV50_17365 [Microbacterium foliorum]|uniref:Uncharacterized protein n=2 Tax=Microbacterium foliorum TaxID=104336 RepID=A0A4Y5YVH4_9MICO|nr:hypothetical protein FIV50_17365 [Microbacterium foliorum]